MKAKLTLLALALVSSVTILGAQGAPSRPSVPTRIVMGGRAVTLVADAVYAFPSARSRVVAVGGTDQGLGVFLEAVAPGFKDLPSFERQAGVEVYAAQRPDLVILKSSLKKSTGAGLEALGIKTAYLSLESPEEYYEELAYLGRLFNDEARAGVLVAYYKDAVARVEKASAAAQVKPGTARPRVLLAQATGDGLEVPPASWIQTRLVELAGGEAVWKGANPGSGWAKVGPEQVAAWNPDVFVLISYKEDATALASRLAADRRYEALKAVRTGRIYGFPQDFLSWDQPDTRWGLGLLWLCDALYPAALAGYSAESEARRFFELFYGLGASDFDRIVSPRLKGARR